MTMQEAIALQPAWIGMWLRVLLLCAFILPVSLVIWKQTRLAGIVTPVASFASAFFTGMLYNQVGYVKLLGLPHIVFWTPVIFFLITVWRKPDLPKIPKVILSVVMGAILISLAFDYVDLLRYLLGDRTPLEGTV
ncbi:MAG: hypothetical protein ABJN14_03060 [Paracoccaceae bacterium]